MKNRLFKTMVAVGTVAMLCACGDDSSSNTTNANTNPGISSASTTPEASPCAEVVATADTWLFDSGNGYWVIYGDGAVTDAAGNLVAAFAEGSIMAMDGTPIVNGVDLNTLTACKANAVVDPGTGEVVVLSSSSVDQGSSASENPNSSGSQNPDLQNPTSSSDGTNPVDPTSSSGTEPVESSSSVNSNPEIGADGFPTIESYGEPPAEYTKDILNNGKTGWSSRYWDACKPHCSWLSSVDTTSEKTYEAGMTVARNCNIHDVEVPAFTLSHTVQQYWMGFEGTNSACDTKDSTGTFTCSDMAPIAVNENLSYGYVAGSGSLYQYGCGKCYHLQYNGGNHANDVKATHKALKGKHIVVMVSNIGYDVEEGQFDMLVPGGGVGAFDALSTMLGVSKSDLGAGSGGFLTECQQSLGWDNTVESYQKCVIAKCEAVFSKWPNLLRGCKWYAEWYMAADNPTYNWEEVECPQYLIDHYMTTINTTKDNRYRWRDDWSSYKKGDELETQECLTADYPQGCGP